MVKVMGFSRPSGAKKLIHARPDLNLLMLVPPPPPPPNPPWGLMLDVVKKAVNPLLTASIPRGL